MAPAPHPDPTSLALDLLDLLSAIRGRAQATRRRVEHVDTLGRDRIAADLAQVEAQADRMARLLFASPDDSPPA